MAPVPGQASDRVLQIPIDRGIGCSANVRADGAALRRGALGGRVAVLNEVALSVGVGVDPASEYLARARALGIPVVRRTSGGSGVLHLPGDLAWTVVLPRHDPRVGRSYAKDYPRLGIGVARFLERLGVEARWIPASGTSPSYCVLGRQGHVLMVGDQILGGAAQHLTRDALLHHGIVPRTLNRPLIGEVFGLGAADGVNRLTCLEELRCSEPATRQAEQLALALAEQLTGG